MFSVALNRVYTIETAYYNMSADLWKVEFPQQILTGWKSYLWNDVISCRDDDCFAFCLYIRLSIMLNLAVFDV